MSNYNKIKNMSIDDWINQVVIDESIVPSLCFMCVGCENCDQSCFVGIGTWLQQEAE